MLSSALAATPDCEEGAMKKSEPEEQPQSPISFHPSSNGEFEPRPVTDRDRRAAAMYRDLVERKSRRLGMTRREFTESASGMVAALFVMNQVYGCGGSSATGGGTGGATGGGSGGASGGGTGGFTRDAGYDVAEDVSAEDAAAGAADARYDVTEDAIE